MKSNLVEIQSNQIEIKSILILLQTSTIKIRPKIRFFGSYLLLNEILVTTPYKDGINVLQRFQIRWCGFEGIKMWTLFTIDGHSWRGTHFRPLGKFVSQFLVLFLFPHVSTREKDAGYILILLPITRQCQRSMNP